MFACRAQALRICVIVTALTITTAGLLRAEAPPLGDRREIITFAPILEKAMLAVVSIAVKGRTPIERSPLYHHPLFGRFGLPAPGPAKTREFVSSASGVIVDAQRGLIMTNVHPLAKADKIKVQLADGREFDAKLIGSDPPTDVAVLRIESHGLKSLEFGDSDKVRVGDIVFAIGSPFGLQGTATMGMVGAVMRSGVGYDSYESFIQVDAAVNAGNSGGPLINQHGELIGINTAILSPTGGNVGIGFAIPVNMSRSIMDQLIAHGRVRRGSIGVRVRDLSAELRISEGVDVHQGALISSMQPGSPAADAGLSRGEVIVGLQGAPIRSAAEFGTRIATMELGRPIELEVAKGGGSRRVTLVIGDIQPAQERLVLPSSVPRLAGVVVGAIEPSSALFGEVKGVEVLEVSKLSRAAVSGLAVGDIITKIDKYQVRAPEDVVSLTKGKTGKYSLDILRDGVPISVTLR